MGLGLASTEAFATMLGGEAKVDGLVGRGSTFTIHLSATYATSRLVPDEQSGASASVEQRAA